MDYIVLDESNGKKKIKCCVCGVEKIVTNSNYKRQNLSHSVYNCKDGYYRMLVGTMIRDYKITEYTGDSLKCVCMICGHEDVIPKNHVSSKSFTHDMFECKEDYRKWMIGKQFGDFTILGYYETNSVLCTCNVCCQTIHTSITTLKQNPRHGRLCILNLPKSEYKDAILRRYNNIVARCTNKASAAYGLYGGRGVQCKYRDSIEFYCDVYEQFEEKADALGVDNVSFDRIDVDGNYEHGNIRVTTQDVQSTNTRRRKFFVISNGTDIVIGDNAMHTSRMLGINGRSLGNVIRGTSKSAGGWMLLYASKDIEDIKEFVKDKNVTTNLITSL